jgi:hypothetical protein
VSGEQTEYKVYPNPVNETLFIHSNENTNKTVGVEIHDVSGRLILIDDVVVQPMVGGKVDIRNLNKGLYFVRVLEGENVLYKVIVE